MEIAKKYQEIAAFNDTYANIEPPKFKRPGDMEIIGESLVPVTAQQFIDAVRKKSGRVKDLAERLKTDEATIEKLIEPATPVYKAERGWLKVRA